MTPMLTVESVKLAAARAYAAGALTAQHPDSRKRECVYTMTGGKYHCAIGAGLTPKTLKTISRRKLTGENVSYLIELGLIKCPDLLTQSWISNIQSLHDAWATQSKNGLSCKDSHALFLAAVMAP